MNLFYGPTWKIIKENVDEAFPFVDKNGDEGIDHAEFKRFLQTMNKNLTDEEIQGMLDEADKDKDRKISRNGKCFQ